MWYNRVSIQYRLLQLLLVYNTYQKHKKNLVFSVLRNYEEKNVKEMINYVNKIDNFLAETYSLNLKQTKIDTFININ